MLMSRRVADCTPDGTATLSLAEGVSCTAHQGSSIGKLDVNSIPSNTSGAAKDGMVPWRPCIVAAAQPQVRHATRAHDTFPIPGSSSSPAARGSIPCLASKGVVACLGHLALRLQSKGMKNGGGADFSMGVMQPLELRCTGKWIPSRSVRGRVCISIVG
jgi:hypothetical protein